MAKKNQALLVKRLAQLTNSKWRTASSGARLTIMDSKLDTVRYTKIVFRNNDGSIATSNDVQTANHILAMPQGETYKASDIDHATDMVRLDQNGPMPMPEDTLLVDWMPIVSDQIFLIIRSEDTMCMLTNSFCIRAFKKNVSMCVVVK